MTLSNSNCCAAITTTHHPRTFHLPQLNLCSSAYHLPFFMVFSGVCLKAAFQFSFLRCHLCRHTLDSGVTQVASCCRAYLLHLVWAGQGFSGPPLSSPEWILLCGQLFPFRRKAICRLPAERSQLMLVLLLPVCQVLSLKPTAGSCVILRLPVG